jgi:predicted dehydrogenase
MSVVRLATLAPGHFHAALIQKRKLPGVDSRVRVYGPLDTDLAAHLNRIIAFNRRDVEPTDWTLEIHAGDDWAERFLSDSPADVVALSGRNRRKIDLMRLAVEAGCHVLADKPWIIDPGDLPRLEAILDKAAAKNLVLHDMMTERFEVTSILQRELVDDPDLFGVIEKGDADSPGVFMESVHYLKKTVAGQPLRRPAWFFDIAQQGEALADVGVHLVDQVFWTLFADEPLDYRSDVTVIDARRWATPIDREQFAAITDLPDFPADLRSQANGATLDYFCNNQVIFLARDVHVRLDVLWDLETPPGGGDTHNAVYRGSRCSVIVRQAGGKLPELFVVPNPGQSERVRLGLERHVDAWQQTYPGTRLIPIGQEFHLYIPEAHRVGHEAHFAEVTAEFLRHLEQPDRVPAWERPNLLAKYFVSTQGVAFARRGPR